MEVQKFALPIFFCFYLFFFNDTATTEIYTLSLHDALPIWALALMIQKDYQRAGVPMLPVVVGEERTAQNIFVYSLALVALTLLFAATDAVGLVYLGSAAVLGAIFVAFAWKLKSDYSIRRAKHLYLFSLLYLALLFAVMLADGVYRF